MRVFLILLAINAVVFAAGYLGRGWVLEFAQQCADNDIMRAKAIREQADRMLFEAELAAITARALTTPTQALAVASVRVRVGRGWTGLKEWAGATFGPDGHEGFEGEHLDELKAMRAQPSPRAKWPLRQRVTPLAMPKHLPPDPERAFRIHTLARTTL